ncbi:MAG: response regulator transcription factor [Dehalococcoidales bacterium]|nr:response regulator transcription factor [Dehalococcoidales bacterium]
MANIRVLVVDDHALFRRGIVAVLTGQDGIEVVGEATDGLEAIKKARTTNPNVILMDLNMPNCNGLEATKALQAEVPRINILILTVSDREADLFTAMRFGARGYILKNVEPEELVRNIFHIAQGGVIVSSLVATNLLDEFKRLAGETAEKKASAAIEKVLSPREEEVLQLVAKGATNKQIADSLTISENTVKTHLRNIMEKLHLANRSQAAAYAAKKSVQ